MANKNKITEAGKSYAGFDENRDPNDSDERYFNATKCKIHDAFVEGANSDAAKEFHTQGLLNKNQVKHHMISFARWMKHVFNIEGYTPENYVNDWIDEEKISF